MTEGVSREDLSEALREALQRTPSRAGWVDVCQQFERALDIDHSWALDECLPLIKEAAPMWPRSMRAAPWDWALKFASGALPDQALGVVSALCASWCFVGIYHDGDLKTPLATAFTRWLDGLASDCPALKGLRISSGLKSLRPLLQINQLYWNSRIGKLRMEPHRLTYDDVMDGVAPWAQEALDRLCFRSPALRELEDLDLSAAWDPRSWMTGNFHYGTWPKAMHPNLIKGLSKLTTDQLRYLNLHGHCRWALPPAKRLAHLTHLDIGGGGHLEKIWPTVSRLPALEVLNANTILHEYFSYVDETLAEWEETESDWLLDYKMDDFFSQRWVPGYMRDRLSRASSLFPSRKQVDRLLAKRPGLRYVEVTVCDTDDTPDEPRVSELAVERGEGGEVSETRPVGRYGRIADLQWSSRYEVDASDEELPGDLVEQLQAALRRLKERGVF